MNRSPWLGVTHLMPRSRRCNGVPVDGKQRVVFLHAATCWPARPNGPQPWRRKILEIKAINVAVATLGRVPSEIRGDDAAGTGHNLRAKATRPNGGEKGALDNQAVRHGSSLPGESCHSTILKLSISSD